MQPQQPQQSLTLLESCLDFINILQLHTITCRMENPTAPHPHPQYMTKSPEYMQANHSMISRAEADSRKSKATRLEKPRNLKIPTQEEGFLGSNTSNKAHRTQGKLKAYTKDTTIRNKKKFEKVTSDAHKTNKAVALGQLLDGLPSLSSSNRTVNIKMLIKPDNSPNFSPTQSHKNNSLSPSHSPSRSPSSPSPPRSHSHSPHSGQSAQKKPVPFEWPPTCSLQDSPESIIGRLKESPEIQTVRHKNNPVSGIHGDRDPISQWQLMREVCRNRQQQWNELEKAEILRRAEFSNPTPTDHSIREAWLKGLGNKYVHKILQNMMSTS